MNNNLSGKVHSPNDEFYTIESDIELEISRYPLSVFKGKTVYSNCDDFQHSAFCRYFSRNFARLGLKRYTATGYREDGKGVRVDITEDGTTVTELTGNGDCFSSECRRILYSSDILVTNPPFSRFRDFMDMLIASGRQFIVIGFGLSCAYVNVFGYYKAGKIFVSTPRSMKMKFKRPNGDTEEVLARWFNNIIPHKAEMIHNGIKYDPSKYIHYSNFDGIEIESVEDIPDDYMGYMALPITRMFWLNREQFEILSIGSGKMGRSIGIRPNHRNRTDLEYIVNGTYKVPFGRIIFKRVKEVS